MYSKGSVGLEEALGAIRAMIDEVKSHPEKYWQHACIAIVDERAKLVAFAKMDSSNQMAQDIAMRKAWTAAMWQRDIADVNNYVANRKFSLDDFTPGASAIPGGLAIVDPREASTKGETERLAKPPFNTSCIGAIGVSAAGPWELDVEVARIGLRYIQSHIWPKD